MASAIKVIQVGLGGWGLDWATKVLGEVPEVELAGCVDRDPKALERASASGVVAPGRCFGSLADAQEQADFDAVLVTTELISHVAVVRAALEAGKHVLVEKPFAPTLAEGEELVELAEKVGRTLMVSQNYRFFPAVRAVQEVVQSGELGQLVHVEIDFRRFSPPNPRTSHRARTWSQPLLLDMSVHHFDLLRAVVPGAPRAVFCRSWNPAWSGYAEPPEGTAVITFDGDLVASYRGSWVHPGRTTAWAGEWRMEFEEGDLWWTSRGDGHDQRRSAADEVWTYRHSQERTPVKLPVLQHIDRSGALAAFAAALAAGSVPETSARDNLGSLALAHAAVESARRHECVELPDRRSESRCR